MFDRAAYMKEWGKKNPKKVRAIARRYYLKHRKKRLGDTRAYYKKNRSVVLEKMHGIHLRKRLRLERATPEVVAWYKSLLKEQGGVCAICKRPPMKHRLAVDHNHKTNEIRGLLCARCNRGIGLFFDDQAMFLRAADYLEGKNITCAHAGIMS